MKTYSYLSWRIEEHKDQYELRKGFYEKGTFHERKNQWCPNPSSYDTSITSDALIIVPKKDTWNYKNITGPKYRFSMNGPACFDIDDLNEIIEVLEFVERLKAK